METNNQKNDQNIIPNDTDKPQKGVNVPNLRFKEFNGNYKACKINEIANVVGGGTPDTLNEKFWNGGINWFTPTEIGHKKYVTISNRTISADGLNNSSAKILPVGSILFSSRATVGESSINLIEATTNQGFQSLVINNDNSNEYIYYLIQTLKKHFIKQACGSTFPEISNSEVSKTKICIPKIQEQYKIAKFFSLLDQRIDTQSKIIEDLQTLKISICDKVFEDTTYPEYKLKDVLSERIEKSNVKNQYEILSSTIKGLFTQKEYFDKDIASSNNIGYKIVHLYDIIISPQNLWMGNITFNQRFTNGLVSPSYKIYIINNNFDMYYIANMLKTKRAMYKYICSSQQGASVVRRNLNMDDFLSLSFSIPDINKQRKIGLLLNTIDKRIDLEQTYLTKLNQQKKFLLKNMFI